MKNNSQHMFLVNFASNEICFMPKSTNIPVLHDWYPVVIDKQGHNLHNIIRYNFGNMKQLAINDIIEIKEDRNSKQKSKNILKRLIKQIIHLKKPENTAQHVFKHAV